MASCQGITSVSATTRRVKLLVSIKLVYIWNTSASHATALTSKVSVD